MSPLIPMIYSAALLVASPLEGSEGGGRAVPAQMFSAAGGILGAATACAEIGHDQLSATAKQVSALAEAEASDLAELAALTRLLMISAAAGRKALQEGKTDCKTVAASFSDLQRAVLQTPIALRRD